jgi:hypothetical protein
MGKPKRVGFISINNHSNYFFEMKKILLTALLLFLTSINVNAQQSPHYTQYMYNMNIINPAYAGSKENLSFGLLYRKQWLDIEDAPTTFSLSGSAPVGKNVGIGLSIISDRIGPVDENNIIHSNAPEFVGREGDDIAAFVGKTKVYFNDDLIPINSFEQLVNLYLIDNNGNYVYYVTFLYNPTTYGVQLITSIVPTSLPAGWTQPTNWYGYPTLSRTPQVQLLSTSNFYQLIGFVNNTYYPITADIVNRSFISTSVPLGSYVNSLIIRCNLVNNSVGFPSDIIDTMPITSTFGSNINYSPPALKWVKLSAGTYQKLEIQFVDQNLNSIPILDNNVCISLLINNKGNPIVETFIEKELPKLTFRN